MSFPSIGAGLLVINGIMNAFPVVSKKLSGISGGRPIFQLLIGLISSVLGLAILSDLF